MRFLLISRPTHPFPPDPGMVDAMKEWVKTHTASGAMEQAWAFAGVGGGGGVLNVDSLEEIEGIMAGYPFRPFTEVELFALTDLDANMDRLREMLARMGG